jgi:hypothetical protein
MRLARRSLQTKAGEGEAGDLEICPQSPNYISNQGYNIYFCAYLIDISTTEITTKITLCLRHFSFIFSIFEYTSPSACMYVRLGFRERGSIQLRHYLSYLQLLHSGQPQTAVWMRPT